MTVVCPPAGILASVPVEQGEVAGIPHLLCRRQSEEQPRRRDDYVSMNRAPAMATCAYVVHDRGWMLSAFSL